MFGSAALVWVLVLGDHTLGYFKTKEACIETLRHVVLINTDGTTTERGAAGLCISVEHPMKGE
jgi:hypothetical protein